MDVAYLFHDWPFWELSLLGELHCGWFKWNFIIWTGLRYCKYFNRFFLNIIKFLRFLSTNFHSVDFCVSPCGSMWYKSKYLQRTRLIRFVSSCISLRPDNTWMNMDVVIIYLFAHALTSRLYYRYRSTINDIFLFIELSHRCSSYWRRSSILFGLEHTEAPRWLSGTSTRLISRRSVTKCVPIAPDSATPVDCATLTRLDGRESCFHHFHSWWSLRHNVRTACARLDGMARCRLQLVLVRIIVAWWGRCYPWCSFYREPGRRATTSCKAFLDAEDF